MKERWMICWDLDETLGTFARILNELEGKPSYGLEPEPSVRYGIEG